VKTSINTPLRRLETFTAAEAIDLLFRIKIVDVTDHHGRLVAIASSVRPVGPTDVKHASRLSVQVQPLDDVVYKIDYPDENALPVLVLNESLDSNLEQGMKSIAKGNPIFVSLVYPGAVREIQTRILVVDALSPDEGHWVNRWIRFRFPPAFVWQSPTICCARSPLCNRIEWRMACLERRSGKRGRQHAKARKGHAPV